MVHDQLETRGIRSRLVLDAMADVPREAFVPPGRERDAYTDAPLSIGHGQTISQPYMVARMTECLGLPAEGWPETGTKPRVLDVGTGSGYQAAVLARCGAAVTSIERDRELGEHAQARLQRLGYDVHVVIGDGSLGYPPDAPYAGIVVGAGAPRVPEPLIEQLAEHARLVIPVGDGRSQRLTIVERTASGREMSTSDRCVFVPLIGRYGHQG